jgi:large subunit ribosomal protein L4
MLSGGGVAFGPKPRDFATGLQKKVYDLAWRTALSYRFRKGELVIVDNALEIESPSTTHLRHIFEKHRWGQQNGRSILVTLEERPLLARALAEEPKAGWTLPWNEVDVKDMLSLGRIVIERQALHNILISHQDDLVRSRFPPKLEHHCPPTELEQILGWSEFRDLELASKEELESLRPELLEQLAEKRIAEAEKHGQAEATRLLISAYNLKSEVAFVYSEQLARHEDLQLLNHEDAELEAKGLEKSIELNNMKATRSEYKAEALRLQNRLQKAEEWRADAETCELQAAEDQVRLDELLGVDQETEAVEEEKP